MANTSAAAPAAISNFTLQEREQHTPQHDPTDSTSRMKRILIKVGKRYGIIMLANVIMLDTALMLFLLFLSSLSETLEQTTTSTFVEITVGNGTTIVGHQLRCHCPCVIQQEQNNNNVTESLSSVNRTSSAGILSDGENFMTQCKPVWNHGALRRVFVCKFLPIGDDQADKQLTRMRRNLLLLKSVGGGSGSSGREEQETDYEDMVNEFQKWKRVYEQYQVNLTTTTETDKKQKQLQTAPNAIRQTDDLLLFDLQPFIHAVDTVLNGSACLLSERQYRDLVRNAPWVDLELFVRVVQDEERTVQERKNRHLTLNNNNGSSAQQTTPST